MIDLQAAYRAHLRRRLVECGVAGTLHEGLVEYLVARRPTGRFLASVLANDLRGAAVRADLENRLGLWNLVVFLDNFAPAPAWGSPTAVEQWLAATEPPRPLFE